jgi:UDP-N-acetylglucosamine:LPS N-acetylglucosamine transferase
MSATVAKTSLAARRTPTGASSATARSASGRTSFDHQSKNADAFACAGAALVAHQRDTTAESLADAIAALMRDTSRRAAMAAAMAGLARPDAARTIADRLEAAIRA